MTTPTGSDSRNARRKFVEAYNATMVKIWREQIVLTGAIRTGALYDSVRGLRLRYDSDVTEAELSQEFRAYGIFVELGTGREVRRGNLGDIGRPKVRQRKRWFYVKHLASVHRLQEMFADTLGEQAALMITNALRPQALAAQVWP